MVKPMGPTDPSPERTTPLFPTLRGAPRNLSPEQVARDQTTRLKLAMVEAVASHGFAETTLNELVGLAGISMTTFYAHFENKQDCFLATLEEIARQAGEQIDAAYREPGERRERLLAALATSMQLAVAEPAPISLAVVDSLTLGRAGVERREGALRTFETIVRQSFDPAGGEVSDLTVRAVAGGIGAVVYRQLRSGRPQRLPGLAEPLADWALGHQSEPGEAARRAMAAAGRPAAPGGESEEAAEREGQRLLAAADARRGRRPRDQRLRILSATATAAVERGYDALTISAISADAGVSNQTFYQHFESKRDAFLAAFEIVAAEASRAVREAALAERGRPEAIGAGIRALSEYFAGRELFARLAFVELPAAGPLALDRADEAMDAFAAFLGQGAGAAPGGAVEDEIALATPGGICAVIQREIAQGRLRALPDLAPELARFGCAARRERLV